MRRLCLILWLLVATPALAGETADLVMKAGADYRVSMAWTVPATGAAVDITGNSYAAQFRSTGGQLYANYSTIVTSAVNGQMQLRLSKTQTRALSGKTGVWDLKQTDASGIVSYRFGGTAKVMPTVTAP